MPSDTIAPKNNGPVPPDNDVKHYLHEEVIRVVNKVDALEDSVSDRFHELHEGLHHRIGQLQTFLSGWLVKISVAGFVVFSALAAWEWSVLSGQEEARKEDRAMLLKSIATQTSMSIQLGMVQTYMEKDLVNQDLIHKAMMLRLEDSIDGHIDNGNHSP